MRPSQALARPSSAVPCPRPRAINLQSAHRLDRSLVILGSWVEVEGRRQGLVAVERRAMTRGHPDQA